MWVRSQYKRILTNCNDFYIDKINSSYTIEGNKGVLGSYSTKEKAMKVLDMIEDCLKDNFERGMYEPCIEFYKRGVFKMPKDDEVE